MRAARLLLLIVLLVAALRGRPRGAPAPPPVPPPCPDPVAVAWPPDQERLGCARAYSAHLAEAAEALRCRWEAPPPRPAGGTRVTLRRASDGWCEASTAPLEGPARLALGLPIDLDTARAADLRVLPGIGPARAARILERRTRDGPYTAVEDLTEVRGIGPGLLEALRPLVVAGARVNAPAGRSPRRSPRTAPPSGGPPRPGAGSR